MAKRRFSPTFKTSSAERKLTRATLLEEPDFMLRDVSSAFGKLARTAFSVPEALGFTAATSVAERSLTNDFGAGTNEGKSSVAAGDLTFCAVVAFCDAVGSGAAAAFVGVVTGPEPAVAGAGV